MEVADLKKKESWLGKFPTMSWSKDAYSNWLSQNAVNVGLGIIGGAVETAVNPAQRNRNYI